MALVNSARPRASLAKQFSNFTNTSAGLDLTLRLIQAGTQIAAGLYVDNVTVTRLVAATTQLALARRYLRFFNFIECFARSYVLLVGGDPQQPERKISTTLELLKTNSLGIYLLLEGLTMLHDMNIWLVPWYTPVLLEANKFLFYAISISITATLWDLFFESAMQSKLQTGDKNLGEKEDSEGSEPGSSANAASSTTLRLKQIIADSCDLTIPGSFIGWIPIGSFEVGIAMVVSTVLVWGNVWARAQR